MGKWRDQETIITISETIRKVFFGNVNEIKNTFKCLKVTF